MNFLPWTSMTVFSVPSFSNLTNYNKNMVRFPTGVGTLLFCTVSRPIVCPTQHPIHWVLEASSGVKRPGREAVRPTLCTAEMKNTFWYLILSSLLHTLLHYFSSVCFLRWTTCFGRTLTSSSSMCSLRSHCTSVENKVFILLFSPKWYKTFF
jgi:hypothetical protein